MSQGNHPYIAHVRGVEQRLGSGDEALRRAVGGDFEAIGKLEYHLLRFGINHGASRCRRRLRQRSNGAATDPG